MIDIEKARLIESMDCTCATCNEMREMHNANIELCSLTFREFHRTNVQRCESRIFGHGINDWTPSDYGNAIAGEVGEMCNKIKKKFNRNEDIPLCEIAHEMADAIIYLDLLAERLKIDLGAAVRDKFNRVSARKGSTIIIKTDY